MKLNRVAINGFNTVQFGPQFLTFKETGKAVLLFTYPLNGMLVITTQDVHSQAHDSYSNGLSLMLHSPQVSIAPIFVIILNFKNMAKRYWFFAIHPIKFCL